MVGLVMLPIIYFSVTWWNSLHQGSTVLAGGRQAGPRLSRLPFWTLWAAYLLGFGALWTDGDPRGGLAAARPGGGAAGVIEMGRYGGYVWPAYGDQRRESCWRSRRGRWGARRRWRRRAQRAEAARGRTGAGRAGVRSACT